MNIEQQVCSPELSDKIRKLGGEEESFFRWELQFGGEVINLIYPNLCICPHFDTQDVREYYPAYTAAELGEMLPESIKIELNRYDLVTGVNNTKRGNEWWVGYYDEFERQEEKIVIQEKTEANARAKMLIYLLENKLIEPYA